MNVHGPLHDGLGLDNSAKRHQLLTKQAKLLGSSFEVVSPIRNHQVRSID